MQKTMMLSMRQRSSLPALSLFSAALVGLFNDFLPRARSAWTRPRIVTVVRVVVQLSFFILSYKVCVFLILLLACRQASSERSYVSSNP